jgi:hypothetical protein
MSEFTLNPKSSIFVTILCLYYYYNFSILKVNIRFWVYIAEIFLCSMNSDKTDEINKKWPSTKRPFLIRFYHTPIIL